MKRLLVFLAAVIALTGALSVTGHALLHRHTFGEIEYIVKPSCRGEGQGKYTCTECGYAKYENLLRLGHHLVLVEEPVKPGCLERGYSHYECDREGCSFVRVVSFPGIGHKTEPGRVVQEATCEGNGQVIMECVREGCDYKISNLLPVLGHDWVDPVVAVEPGEKTEGRRDYSCSRCDKIRSEAIPPLNKEWDVTVSSGENYTVDPAGTVRLRGDGELNFTVTPAEGWTRGESFAVTAANAVIREEEDGSFTICRVEANTTVTVSGLVAEK